MKSLSVSYFTISFCSSFVFQTEIAKRLNAILAQIMPFLSQEVSFECCSPTASQFSTKIKLLIVACILKILLQNMFQFKQFRVIVCDVCPHF